MGKIWPRKPLKFKGNETCVLHRVVSLLVASASQYKSRVDWSTASGAKSASVLFNFLLLVHGWHSWTRL